MEEVQKITLKECLKLMVDQFRELEDHKEDVKLAINAAWESLENSDLSISSAGFKQKQLEKIAKAICKGKTSDFEDEYEKIGVLLERALGYGKEEE